MEHLDGIFAFSLWDRTKGALLFGRDQIGVKLLFYVENEEEFIFSSELENLLADQESL